MNSIHHFTLPAQPQRNVSFHIPVSLFDIFHIVL